MERIVIATDGSPSAREAVNFGLELAFDEDAAVTFVHVAPGEPSADDYQPLVRAGALAAKRGVEATTKLLRGHPADEIVAYADAVGADLIVVGSRGHRAGAGPLLGSVSHDVLAETRKPVLVVRGVTAAVPAGAEPVAVG